MADEGAESPEFDNPPVIEAVIGVQFVPLLDFTAGHAGWFWRECLGEGWPKAVEAAPVPDQFERFGDEQPFEVPRLGITLFQTKPVSRLQVSNGDDDRMVQLQSSRFHYNWRKRDRDYPRHRQARAEFGRWYELFRDFATRTGLGTLVPNQWELTYVNHFPRGKLWQHPGEWHRILPGLLPEPVTGGAGRFESVGGEWRYEVAPHRGRVHLAVQHGKTVGEAPVEVLIFQLTARGAVSEELGWGLEDGLDLGHAEVRRLFTALTSADAQRAWGKRR